MVNSPFVHYNGSWSWLGLLTVLISIVIVSYSSKQHQFYKLQYLVLIGWATLTIAGFIVPGPWCVPAQAILKYSAIISFVCVLLSSMVVPRAWCRYICPDGGLLRLLGRGEKPSPGQDDGIGL